MAGVFQFNDAARVEWAYPTSTIYDDQDKAIGSFETDRLLTFQWLKGDTKPLLEINATGPLDMARA